MVHWLHRLQALPRLIFGGLVVASALAAIILMPNAIGFALLLLLGVPGMLVCMDALMYL
jgi:hypothetical protein